MRPDPASIHEWRLAPRQAAELQRELASRVREVPLTREVETIAGIDVSVRKGLARAAVVVMSIDPLEVIETRAWQGEVAFPYVPGLLSFREMPAIIPALDALKTTPDVFMLDAQGLAHPRRFGLACHLGVYFDVPAFGVAKTRLTGASEEPAIEKGSYSDLLDGDEVIGRVVRTRTGVKPVYVSVGHRITLEEAVSVTLRCAPRFRLPEPSRQAHRLSLSDCRIV